MWLLLLAIALLGACSRPLPDPESAGAKLYQARCSGCHELFHPGSLTAAMWEMQVDRKPETLVRSGMPPLSERERALLLGYLKAHSSNARPQSAGQP